METNEPALTLTEEDRRLVEELRRESTLSPEVLDQWNREFEKEIDDTHTGPAIKKVLYRVRYAVRDLYKSFMRAVR